MRAVERRLGAVDADRGAGALGAGRVAVAGDRAAFDVGGDRQAEEARGSSGVASIKRAWRVRPGASPAPARATIPSGRCVPGRFGSGSTQSRARGELGADPVGLVGQGDQVGIALAGRVELVGLGGGDDLREEGPAGLGVPGLGRAPAAAAWQASSIWRGVKIGAACRVSPGGPRSSGRPSPRCPGAGRRRGSASSRRGTATTIDWSNEADRAVGSSRFALQSRSRSTRLLDPAAEPARASPAAGRRPRRPGSG